MRKYVVFLFGLLSTIAPAQQVTYYRATVSTQTSYMTTFQRGEYRLGYSTSNVNVVIKGTEGAIVLYDSYGTTRTVISSTGQSVFSLGISVSTPGIRFSDNTILTSTSGLGGSSVWVGTATSNLFMDSYSIQWKNNNGVITVSPTETEITGSNLGRLLVGYSGGAQSYYVGSNNFRLYNSYLGNPYFAMHTQYPARIDSTHFIVGSSMTIEDSGGLETKRVVFADGLYISTSSVNKIEIGPSIAFSPSTGTIYAKTIALSTGGHVDTSYNHIYVTDSGDIELKHTDNGSDNGLKLSLRTLYMQLTPLGTVTEAPFLADRFDSFGTVGFGNSNATAIVYGRSGVHATHRSPQTHTSSITITSGGLRIQGGHLMFPDNTILTSTANIGGGGVWIGTATSNLNMANYGILNVSSITGQYLSAWSTGTYTAGQLVVNGNISGTGNLTLGGGNQIQSNTTEMSVSLASGRHFSVFTGNTLRFRVHGGEGINYSQDLRPLGDNGYDLGWWGTNIPGQHHNRWRTVNSVTARAENMTVLTGIYGGTPNFHFVFTSTGASSYRPHWFHNVVRVSTPGITFADGTVMVSTSGFGGGGWVGTATSNLNMDSYRVYGVSDVVFLNNLFIRPILPWESSGLNLYDVLKLRKYSGSLDHMYFGTVLPSTWSHNLISGVDTYTSPGLILNTTITVQRINFPDGSFETTALRSSNYWIEAGAWTPPSRNAATLYKHEYEYSGSSYAVFTLIFSSISDTEADFVWFADNQYDANSDITLTLLYFTTATTTGNIQFQVISSTAQNALTTFWTTTNLDLVGPSINAYDVMQASYTFTSNKPSPGTRWRIKIRRDADAAGDTSPLHAFVTGADIKYKVLAQ